VQLKPFYFNVGVFLYFLLLMMFIIAMEGLVFRLLEVKYAKTDSAKYYMLKTTARRSMAVMAVWVVVLLLVLTPFMLDTVTEVTSETGATSGATPFFSRDALGLTTVDRISLDSDAPTGVLILSEANYLLYYGDWDLMRQYSEASIPDASSGVTITFPAVPFGQYYLVAEDEVSYSIHRSMSAFFVGFVTLFAVLFIGSHAAWLVYTTPLRQRFVKGAIYR